MSTFGLTPGSSLADVIGGVNYVLTNVGSIQNGVVVANTLTGEIRINGGSNALAYMYQYLYVRYATSSDGSTGFSTSPINATYYGLYNTPTATPSSNPTDYIWYQASGGFGTTKELYYVVTGGGQILVSVTTGPPTVDWQDAASGPIDLTSITNLTIANGSITASQILNNTLTSAQIQLNGITGNSIAQNTITGNLIAVGTIYGNAIQANTLDAAAITAGTITGAQLQTGLLVSGNIVSYNATLGNTQSPGYWLNYADGDARFGGNVSVGANLTVEGLITSSGLNNSTVNTQQVVPKAITNFVTTDYDFANPTTNWFEMPKFTNVANNITPFAANNWALVMAATIVPESRDSTIAVNYEMNFSSNTNGSSNGIRLYRSQREGNSSLSTYPGSYFPRFSHNFRSAKLAFADPNNTSNIANAFVLISGYSQEGNTSQNLSSGNAKYYIPDANTYAKNTANTMGLLYIAQGFANGNTIVSNASSLIVTGNTQGAYAYTNALSYSDYTLSNSTTQGVVNGYRIGSNVYATYPTGYFSDYQGFITDTAYESWKTTTGTSVHPSLAVTSLVLSNVANTLTQQTGGQILRIDNDTANATITIEANTVYGLNAIASNTVPFNPVSNYTAIAVGHNGLILSSDSRNYTNGVFSNANAWVQEGFNVSGNYTYTASSTVANIHGVATNTANGIMTISTFTQGAGAVAGSNISNVWVAVGENGSIFWRDRRYGNTANIWNVALYAPPNLQGITLRSVCYDYYRYRWWAVGDAGYIIYANDYWTPNDGASRLLWQQYNSGTTRDLYSIVWDPVTTYWTAVGDGIVLSDTGDNFWGNMRSYPFGGNYAFNAVSGTPPNFSLFPYAYEPIMVENYFSGSGGSLLIQDGAYQFGANNANTLVNWQPITGSSSQAVQLQNNTIFSATYIEQAPLSGQTAWQRAHFEGVPVTFYVVVTAGANGNVYFQQPSMTITEYKR